MVWVRGGGGEVFGFLLIVESVIGIFDFCRVRISVFIMVMVMI